MVFIKAVHNRRKSCTTLYKMRLLWLLTWAHSIHGNEIILQESFNLVNAIVGRLSAPLPQ